MLHNDETTRLLSLSGRGIDNNNMHHPPPTTYSHYGSVPTQQSHRNRSSTATNMTNSSTVFPKQQQQQQYSLRFMVMIYTGITFLICVIWIFVQSALSIQHQHHRASILPGPDLKNVISYNGCHTSSSTSVDCRDSCTFRQLGQIMVPSAYQAMMDTIHRHLLIQPSAATTATATTTTCVTNVCLPPPSNVNTVRKQILYVRDLLDVFSPIYRNTTSKTTSVGDDDHHHRESYIDSIDDDDEDPWATLRKELDRGYTLIGQYQDLDHSHVHYTSQDIYTLQYQILQWYQQCTTSTTGPPPSPSSSHHHDPTHGTNTAQRSSGSTWIQQYLSLTNETTTITAYSHAAESHFFWKSILQRLESPHGGVTTIISMNSSALTMIQLLLDQQIRIAQTYYIRAYPHESVWQNDSDQMDYHNLRKVLRSIVDEYNMFFTPTSSASSECNNSIVFLDHSVIAISTDDIRIFDTARQMLGDLNDDWNAYKFYINHKKGLSQKHDENESDEYALIQTIDSKWDAFKSWSKDTVDLLGVFTRLLESN